MYFREWSELSEGCLHMPTGLIRLLHLHDVPLIQFRTCVRFSRPCRSIILNSRRRQGPATLPSLAFFVWRGPVLPTNVTIGHGEAIPRKPSRERSTHEREKFEYDRTWLWRPTDLDGRKASMRWPAGVLFHGGLPVQGLYLSPLPPARSTGIGFYLAFTHLQSHFLHHLPWVVGTTP